MRLRIACALVALSFAAVPAGAADSAAGASKVARYLDAVAAGLPAIQRSTLDRIRARQRQLLALRAYLRAGESLQSRWSWSSDEITAYEQSAEYQDALAHLGRIVQRFAADNPGYTLYVNTQVRSLETQLERWDSNASVGEVADVLQRAAADVLQASSYPRTPNARATERFAAFLAQWMPQRAANLAAPGLSPHGRARAFDFQVQRQDEIVAGTDAADAMKAWDAEGWTRKVAAAVAAASDKFHGPLTSPHEPWHYEYRP